VVWKSCDSLHVLRDEVLTMATALLYGSLASSSFVIGVLLGLFTSPPRRLVAGIIGFGAGVLVSALTFDLMREAFDTGGAAYAIGGFLIGAVIYVAADVVLERMAAKSPKRTGRDPTDVVPDAEEKPESPKAATVAGTALLVGAVIDGIPESIAIGVSLHSEGPSLGLVLLAAVFLANVPESLGSAAAMKEEGRSRGYILGVWAAVALVCVVSDRGRICAPVGAVPRIDERNPRARGGRHLGHARRHNVSGGTRAWRPKGCAGDCGGFCLRAAVE